MRRTTTILSTIALLTLAGCAENPISSVSRANSHSTISQSNIKKVQEKLTIVKAAINAGNFVVARKEFSKVESTWKMMESSIRALSSNSYISVEIYMDEVKQTLYSRPLSREKAILSLHSLERSIESVTTS